MPHAQAGVPEILSALREPRTVLEIRSVPSSAYYITHIAASPAHSWGAEPLNGASSYMKMNPKVCLTLPLLVVELYPLYYCMSVALHSAPGVGQLFLTCIPRPVL